MSKPQLLGIIRHVLTFAGGIAIAKGVIDETMATEMVGAIVSLIGVVWSFIEKEQL
jgi:hypothetical protein